MSFGAGKGVARRLADFRQCNVLVPDLSDVPQVDFTSDRALEDMLIDAQARGRQVCMVGLRSRVRFFLFEQGVLSHISPHNIIEQRLTALEHAVALIDAGFRQENPRSIT